MGGASISSPIHCIGQLVDPSKPKQIQSNSPSAFRPLKRAGCNRARNRLLHGHPAAKLHVVQSVM
jgi:hypothetical protein